MTALPRLAALAALAFAATACTPAEPEKTEAPAPAETRTVVETREVPVPQTVVVESPEVPAVVVERDRRDDSTTVRAGRDGIEVETTNR